MRSCVPCCATTTLVSKPRDAIRSSAAATDSCDPIWELPRSWCPAVSAERDGHVIEELPREIGTLQRLETPGHAVFKDQGAAKGDRAPGAIKYSCICSTRISTLPKKILKKLLTTGTMVGRIDQRHLCTTLGSFPGFSIGGID
jgi:hypothetical protein